MARKILILGKTSYVGTSLMKFINENNTNILAEAISVRDNTWKDISWEEYDTVINFIGIAHRLETRDNEHEYYKINRDLAISIAEKAKKDGINYHVFMSSMSVYGLDSGVIDNKTKLNPQNAYGRSKLEAEVALKALESDTFKVAIVRPPMIYGPHSPGNYKRLSNLSKNFMFFPKTNNQRSMIFIDNLSNYLVEIIQRHEEGIHFPQNKKYINTSELVSEIANVNRKKMILIPFPLGLLLKLNVKIFSKIFGDLVYDQKLSVRNFDYTDVDFEDSIRRAEIE